jgi:DNA-binding SARP family transcriptional activator
VPLKITLAGDVTIGELGAARPARRLTGNRDRVALAMLVLERHRGVSRDALAEAVWAEGLPATWPSGLRNVVSRVRAFVAEVVGDQTPAINPAEGGRYHLQLPPDAVVDVEQAEAALHQARQSLDAGRTRDAHELAREAATCLRSPFLPDQDGEWATTERERYAELHVAALELASQAANDHGDPASALAAAQEAIASAPLRESAHRLAMRAHADAGNRAEALRTYQQLRHRLAEEMGVDPTPETEADYVEVLLGPTPGPYPGAGSAPGGRDEPAPFVDRADELARLSDAWAATTASRRARVVLVLGEAGIGKSRLVGEAARRIAAEGGMVLFGRCEADSGIAFQPLAEVLANLVAVLPDGDLPALDPAARGVLAAAFPSLGGGVRPSVAVPRRDEPVDRARLSSAVSDLLTGVTRQRPLLVVLDDLQWIEADTVVVLLHLIAELSGSPLMAVALVRDPPTPSDMFHSTLHNLERTVDVDRIEVGGLDEEGARALVAAVRPEAGTHTAAVARRLWTATSGNPFMLLDLLQQAGTAGIDDAGALADEPGIVPRGILDLVEARLRALAPRGRDLLRAAAVLGLSFDLDVAAEAATLDPVAALDGLDTALDAGLVHEVGPDRYRFTHDIVQRTLHDQLSGARRRALHARCADAIEALRADDLDEHAAAMARHCLATAGTRGDRRAVRWACAAARQAGDWGAHAEARRLYHEALRHVPDGEAHLHAEVATALGLTEQALDEPAAGRTLLDAAALAQACGHHTAAARAALGLADLADRRPELRSPTAALLADLAATPPPPPPSSSSSTGNDDGDADTGDDAVLWGRVVARAAALDVVVRPPDDRRSQDLDRAATALAHHLGTLTGPDRVAERQVAADDLAALADAVGHAPGRRVAAHHRAMTTALHGLDDVAEDGTAGAVDEAAADVTAVRPDAATDPAFRALEAERTVAAAVTAGRFDQARTLATTWCPPSAGDDAPPADLVAEVGLAPPGTMACRQLVVADWLQGRLHPRLAGEADDRHPAERALAHLAADEPGRAHLVVRSLLVDGTTLRSDDDTWLHDVGLLALVGARLGDEATAAAIHARLAPYAELSCGAGYRSFVGTARFHLGCLAATGGDWADAERNLMAAMHDATRRRARPWLALAQAALAGVLDHRGRSSDRELADRLRSEARWTSEQLGLAVVR